MFDSGGSSDFTYIDVGGRWTWTEIVIVAVVLLVLTVVVMAAQEDERPDHARYMSPPLTELHPRNELEASIYNAAKRMLALRNIAPSGGSREH